MTSQKICVGFGKTQIDPWDIFRRELIALIDTDSVICREIFNLSRSKFEKIEHVEDGEGFFNGLEKFFENRREEVVKYLHKLTKKQNLHVNEGSTSVASLLMNYAKHCREHEQRLKQIQICPTSPLIGRKREIAHALDCLQSSQCKGVWISGLDGMGKTSLAFEICRRLFIENWRIFKVELREQLYVGDLVRSALEVIGGPFLLPPTAGLSDEVLESSTEDDDFVAYDNYCTKSLFIQNFWEHGQNKVYVLDGVDEILTHDETEFYLFLGMLLERIREAENKLNSEGKSRILITTQTQVRKSPVIRKNFIEIELKGLSINDAKEFLREKSKPVNVQVNEKDMEAIASDCGFSPLAMVLVLNNQRDSNKPDEPIVVPNENMSVNARNSVSCVNVYLEKSVLWLENPDKNYTLITLMRLAVFRTLNFTIDAACFICGKEDSGKANMLNVIMSLRNRYLLETTVERFKENEDSKEGYEQPSFYIHTLVYNILRKKEESYMSYVQDSRKRFVEYMDKKLSKVTEKSLIELLKIDENFKSHVQLFIKYLTEMPFLRPSLEDGPGIVGRINREWIAEWIVDSHAKCKYYKEIIAESKRDSNASETVYYLMCLAKLYFDHYKFDQCRVALSESLDIVENDHKLSKEANYIKRKKKSKNCFHSIVLSKVWTMQARVLNVEGKYDKGEEYVKFALVATEKKTEECWHDRANIHNLLGIILFKLERYKEAEMNHKYAHDILTSHEGFWNEEVYLTNIGTALFKQVDKELPENHILEHAGQYYSSALNVKTSTPHNKARTLSFRGKLYLKIGKLEESHKDLQASLDIWKATVQSPNINLISAYHNLSTLLLRKCTKLFQMDKIIEASRVLASAYNNYQEIQSQIAKGGFNNWQRNLTMYDQIKKNHRRVLRQVNKEEKEIDLVNNFYSDFESGIFNRTGPQNEFLEREEEFSPLSEERIASSNYDVTSDSSSAVCITSDEDRKLSEQTFKDISGTGSPNNSYQDKNYRGNNQFRNQVDSGLGDSITSLSSLSESGNYWSTSSGSIEEEVFPNEDETRDDSWKKRKSLDKSKTQNLKRQKNLDVDEKTWTTLF